MRITDRAYGDMASTRHHSWALRNSIAWSVDPLVLDIPPAY
jgi:hypothetical protein